jgi:hypothetical protein
VPPPQAATTPLATVAAQPLATVAAQPLATDEVRATDAASVPAAAPAASGLARIENMLEKLHGRKGAAKAKAKAGAAKAKAKAGAAKAKATKGAAKAKAGAAKAKATKEATKEAEIGMCQTPQKRCAESTGSPSSAAKKTTLPTKGPGCSKCRFSQTGCKDCNEEKHQRWQAKQVVA